MTSVPDTAFSSLGDRKSTMSSRPFGKWKTSSEISSSVARRSTYCTPGTRNAVLRIFCRTARSEERRVGKECRPRRSPEQYNDMGHEEHITDITQDHGA